MAIQSYILATGAAAEAASLQPGADAISIASIEFGSGHSLSDDTTVGLETPLVPPRETSMLNYAAASGPQAQLGIQLGGDAEFTYSEMVLRLGDAGKTAYARIVDDTGDLNGKNASAILVALMNVRYANPPDNANISPTTAAPLAMLMATQANAGAVRFATDAEFLAGAADRVPSAAQLSGSGQNPKTAGAGVRLDSLIADGFTNIPAGVMATAPDKPADAAVGEAVIHRQNNHWQLIDGAGNIYAKVGAGAWARASGKPADVQKWTAPGNYVWNKPDGAERVVIQMKASGFGSNGGYRDQGQDYPGRAVTRNLPDGYVVIDIPAEYLPASCAVVVPAGGAGGAGSPSGSMQNGGAAVLASFNGWTSDLNYVIGRSSPARGGAGGGGNPDGRIGFDVAAMPSPLPLIFGAGGAAGRAGAPNGQPGTAPSGNGGAGYGANGKGGDGGAGEVIVTTHFG